MEDSGNGFRRFLEVRVEALQEELYALERDPEQIEPLKSILRICQELRHARQPQEPEEVRLVRNAVEKVTLHLGRADLAVSRDFLDFYVDSFDLLEEAVRDWPPGSSFDRARYADRVRSLLDLTQPRRGFPDGGAIAGWEPLARGGAEEPEPFAGTPPAVETVPVSPWEQSTAATAAQEEQIVVEAIGAGLQDVPTWSEEAREPVLELLDPADLTPEEREQYVEADLRELLTEPWPGPAEVLEPVGSALPGEEGTSGSLAASFSTFEELRAANAYQPSSVSTLETSPEAEAAVNQLRDVLDAFSLSLNDLDRASERLLREDLGRLGSETLSALVKRLELERDKLLSVFERTIESFRA